MQNLDFAHRIGVSNLCLRGLSPSAAIDQTLEAGFAALEFTPISYGGPEAFSPAERRELRRQLSRFKVVTVHSSGMGGANICSADPARREHARRRYLELVGFARDVEADVLTVHPGGMDPEGPTKEEVFAQNVAFGKEMAHAAGTAAMQLGYELFDARIGRQIGRKNFGENWAANLQDCVVARQDLVQLAK